LALDLLFDSQEFGLSRSIAFRQPFYLETRVNTRSSKIISQAVIRSAQEGKDELTNGAVAFSYFSITPLDLLFDTLLLRGKSLHL
jgi:hypothetical protein